MQSQVCFGLLAATFLATCSLSEAQEPPKGFVSQKKYEELQGRFDRIAAEWSDDREFVDRLQRELDSEPKQKSGGLRFFLAGTILGGAAGLGAGLFYRSQHKNDWKTLPPTDRQLEYADSLGIYQPESYSRGDLSELIDHAKQQQARG